MPTHYTILIDDREKKPFSFPDHLVVWDPHSDPLNPRTTTVRLLTRSAHLETGDYVLAGSDGRPLPSCCIERKQDLSELFNNLSTPHGRRRFLSEMARLQSYQSRILLLEGDPISLQRTRNQIPPEVVRDLLFHMLGPYQVELWMLPCGTLPARLAAASWVAARLIGASLWPSPQTTVKLPSEPPEPELTSSRLP